MKPAFAFFAKLLTMLQTAVPAIPFTKDVSVLRVDHPASQAILPGVREVAQRRAHRSRKMQNKKDEPRRLICFGRLLRYC